MALTRIKSTSILDKEVKEQDLADGAVTFDKIQISSGGAVGEALKVGPGGTLIWELATGTTSALDTLVDVDTTGKLDGDSLVWDGGASLWKPGSNVPSSLSLNSLTDVTLGSVAQNDFLRYDGFNWVSDKVSVIYVENIQPVAVTGLLDALLDVEVGGATTDQRLGFDGAQWRAVDAAELSTIDAFSDVDTTGKVDGDAFVYDGGTLTWGAVNIGGLGASSRTTIVTDITTMLGQSLKLGDQTYVQNGVTTGEWEMYLLHTLPGSVIGEWSKIATEDSARTDSNTLVSTPNITFATDNGDPETLLGNISAGSRVTLVTVEVITAFDDTPDLTVGTDATPDLLIDNTLLDLEVESTYTVTTDILFPAGSDTEIKVFFNKGTTTVGEVRVLVSYV